MAPVGIVLRDLSYAGKASAPCFKVTGKEVWDQSKEDLSSNHNHSALMQPTSVTVRNNNHNAKMSLY